MTVRGSQRAVTPDPSKRRDGREAEGAPLLREYGSKAHRGFESLSLRHYPPRFPPSFLEQSAHRGVVRGRTWARDASTRGRGVGRFGPRPDGTASGARGGKRGVGRVELPGESALGRMDGCGSLGALGYRLGSPAEADPGPGRRARGRRGPACGVSAPGPRGINSRPYDGPRAGPRPWSPAWWGLGGTGYRDPCCWAWSPTSYPFP